MTDSLDNRFNLASGRCTLRGGVMPRTIPPDLFCLCFVYRECRTQLSYPVYKAKRKAHAAPGYLCLIGKGCYPVVMNWTVLV